MSRTNLLADHSLCRFCSTDRSSYIKGILLFSCLLLFFFRDALFNTTLPLFRDSSNFFYPLWAYVINEYRQSRLPLWNSYLNFGAPLAAENSCAAFYPGIAILALPLPFHVCYLLFLVIHLSFAAWGIVRLARQCGLTAQGASLAAISYPFSGYVIFQIYNPIFLISAAWLPWAVEAMLSLVLKNDGPRPRLIVDPVAKNKQKNSWQTVSSLLSRDMAVLRFGLFLALMVLGGDPQTAYHCVLLALVTWVATIIGAAKRRLGGDRSYSRLRASIGLGVPLALAILIGFLLAAVQIIPTLAYASVSERILLKSLVFDAASTNRQKAPQDRASASINTLADAAIARQRLHWQRVIYDFSTPAYRWIEFLWPNFGGRPLSFNTRWIAAIFPEGRWWTPSLYMGLFPFLLAVSSLRFCPGKRNSASGDLDWEGQKPGKPRELNEQYLERIRVWFSWVSVFSLVAALGWYGPAGIWQALWGGEGGQSGGTNVLPPVGGVYWFLTCVLPGYRFFRYPSKWLVFATLALSILGALALDRLHKRTMRRLVRTMTSLLIIFLLAFILFLLAWPLWDYAQRSVPPDPVFGAFEAQRAKWETLRGLAVLVALIALALGVTMRSSPRDWPMFIIGVTALDLAINQCWMIFAVDIRGDPPVVADAQPPRRFWQKWCDYPKEWLEPSPARIEELHAWERETSAVRWGMVTGNVPLQSYGTLIPADYYVFLAVLHEFMNRHGLAEPPAETLALLGAFPSDHGCTGGPTKRENVVKPLELDQSRYCFFSHHYIQQNSMGFPHLNIWQLIEFVFFPGQRPRGPSDPLVVEASGPIERGPPDEAYPDSRGPVTAMETEYCQLREFQPGRVVIEACVTKPGILVLGEQCLPGWRVRVVSQDRSTSWNTSPLRVNRIMMGVALPPGKWETTWTYRDSGLFLGAAISAMAWIAIICMTLLQVVRRWRSESPTLGEGTV